MKKILKSFKQIYTQCSFSLLVLFLVLLGCGVVGATISLVIAGVGSEDEIPLLAGPFIGAAGIIIVLFGSVISGDLDFQIACMFGKARKDYLPVKYVYYATVNALIIFMVKSFDAITRILCTNAFSKGAFLELVNISNAFAVAAIFAVPVVVILASGLMVIFEMKFFWVIWALWMFGTLGIPRISSAMRHNPESFAAKLGFFFMKAAEFNTTQTVIAIFVVALIIAIGDMFLYRKLEVKL